ncbi:MAG: nuclear transport factor 2 family protein [Gemmatimonadota bacterium]
MTRRGPGWSLPWSGAPSAIRHRPRWVVGIGVWLTLSSSLVLVPRAAVAQNPTDPVSAVLDDLHRLAHEGDFDAYFDLYTPDAIFMGTDATERWTVEDFKGYARPAFQDGHGWSYEPTERHVYLAPDGRTAWFDERLQNESYGETRGTGVLLLGADDRWRIAQYNLTIPIPNDLASEFVARIRETTGGG